MAHTPRSTLLVAVVVSAVVAAGLFFSMTRHTACTQADLDLGAQKVTFLMNRVRNLTLALRLRDEQQAEQRIKATPMPDHPPCQDYVNRINTAHVEIESLRIMLEERERERQETVTSLQTSQSQRAELQAEVASLRAQIELLKSGGGGGTTPSPVPAPATSRYTMDWSDGGKFRKFALMSIDTEDRLYNFFAPLTALLWTRLVGIRPVYMVFKYSEPSPTMKLILEYTERAGAHLEYVDHPLQAGYTRGCVVMTSRYLVGAWDMPEDHYVMLSDVDMWPLNRDFFHRQDPTKDVHLLYANPYGHPLTAPRYASCYVGMNISLWRTTMQVEKGDLQAELKDLLDRELTPQAAVDVQWAFDQNIFAKLLRQWPRYPAHVQFVERDVNRDRIDRSRWHFSGSLDGIVESHLLRPGYLPHHWSELRRLAAAALGNNAADLRFFDEFHDKYCSLEDCNKE